MTKDAMMSLLFEAHKLYEIAGHDAFEAKARHYQTCEKVKQYLSDAIDALEIEPPAPHVALSRMKTILKLLAAETNQPRRSN